MEINSTSKCIMKNVATTIQETVYLILSIFYLSEHLCQVASFGMFQMAICRSTCYYDISRKSGWLSHLLTVELHNTRCQCFFLFLFFWLVGFQVVYHHQRASCSQTCPGLSHSCAHQGMQMHGVAIAVILQYDSLTSCIRYKLVWF